MAVKSVCCRAGLLRSGCRSSSPGSLSPLPTPGAAAGRVSWHPCGGRSSSHGSSRRQSSCRKGGQTTGLRLGGPGPGRAQGSVSLPRPRCSPWHPGEPERWSRMLAALPFSCRIMLPRSQVEGAGEATGGRNTLVRVLRASLSLNIDAQSRAPPEESLCPFTQTGN